MHDLRGRVLAGTFAHAPVRGAVEILDDALVEIDAAGAIAAVIPRDDPRHAATLSDARAAGRLERIPAGAFAIPGFVDLHIHAPQYPQLGAALDAPLEVWLHRYTFPLEARYADLAFARRAYTALVDDLLANGTTTALMFATVHTDATRLLADIAVEKGLRALIGKVAMDDPAACPPDLRDASPEAALAGTQTVIDHIFAHPDNAQRRVLPVVTPRFIPSCTDPTLEGLGALARACGCHVQTHCSESDWEHAFVLKRMGRTDAEALDGFGLVGRRTVLAHAGFLTPADMDLVRRRGAGIAHCPVSNAYFANAIFPLRSALEKGLRVGLGTDISGGPIASILDAMRMAVAASRMLEDGVDPDLPAERRGRPGSRIDWRTAFHLATAGGADALDLPVGLFMPGRRFDALVVDPHAPAGTVRLFEDLSTEEVLARSLYTASRPNIAGVYVDGRSRTTISARN
ncbi:guanine deaminase [Chthonobacter albigriseus]|uniref:guanine deaminase n=1 Tax=Chthonobacter albigriseus TaxID=1683161 RepID=UPI0015EE6988|nr:guanine deaminase [Chthonobacter albigriseus]